MLNLFNRKFKGKDVGLYSLKNKNGTEVFITNYGARVVSWIFRDVDVVVGFENLDGYLNSTEFYYGATIGRFANRIANAKFSLNRKEYHVQQNIPPNQLHGGVDGFHKQVWNVENATENKIELSYFSKDGEEGYPGNLNVNLTYTLSDDDELVIEYMANTDQATVINLTHHSYFNLNGQGSGSILNHAIEISANRFTPMNDSLLPTGAFSDVEKTSFDFRAPRIIGERINNNDEQLKFGRGYDHNFVLNKEEKMSFAARAIGDKTGIVLEVYTDQPGMQFYTGNFMTGENTIKGAYKDEYRTAFCLETQHFPDSPNQPNFPSTVLEPGEIFSSGTIYKLLKQ